MGCFGVVTAPVTTGVAACGGCWGVTGGCSGYPSRSRNVQVRPVTRPVTLCVVGVIVRPPSLAFRELLAGFAEMAQEVAACGFAVVF